METRVLQPPIGACNTSPIWSYNARFPQTYCIDCVGYLVYFNINPCYSAKYNNQWAILNPDGSVKLTFKNSPGSSPCNTSPNYNIVSGTTCIIESGICTNYTIYKNSNICATGVTINQWAIFNPNGDIKQTFTSQPPIGACDREPTWINSGQPYCNISNLYVQKQINTNQCYTGTQVRDYEIGSCAPFYNLVSGSTCIGCTNYTIYKNSNIYFTGNNQWFTYYNSGTTYTSQPTISTCNYDANYVGNLGSVCIVNSGICTNYTIRQNDNGCYTEAYKWKTDDGTLYTSQPPNISCNYSANYNIVSGTTCIIESGVCTNYTIYKNSNICATGDQWAIFNPDGNIKQTFTSQPTNSPCNTSPNYNIVSGTTCIIESGVCTNYTIYKNSNICATGNTWAIFNPNGTIKQTYTTQPANSPCNTVANYTTGDDTYGSVCINESGICTNYNIRKNQNICFTGNTWEVNGTTYATQPTNSPCDRGPNYTGNFGSVCINESGICTNYTIRKNNNPCFTGNTWEVNGTTYASEPTNSPCDREPTWVNSGQPFCEGEYRYQKQINTNPCYTGDPDRDNNIGDRIWTRTGYYCEVIEVNNEIICTSKEHQIDNCGNERTIGAGEHCDRNANYTTNRGTSCIGNINYTIKENDNPCYTGAYKWKTDDGTLHTSQPANSPCVVINTNPIYNQDGYGVLCIEGYNYTIYKNSNTNFTGDNQWEVNGTTYNYQPVSDPCPPPINGWQYNVIRCDDVNTTIIADSSSLGQNVYSSSGVNGGTCYTIISGPTGVTTPGSTYYYVGDCSSKDENNQYRCAQY
jgi:hypothetical protein